MKIPACTAVLSPTEVERAPLRRIGLGRFRPLVRVSLVSSIALSAALSGPATVDEFGGIQPAWGRGGVRICARKAEKSKGGDAEAQFRLGVRASKNQNEAGFKDAARWYRLAAEQGHAKAQNNLGVLYAKGKGVRKNDAEAAKWFRLAAEQGHAWAQYNLGGSYDAGEGVRQNKDAAARWNFSAAMKGHPWAQYNLGMACFLAQEYKEATRWLRRAAQQGHAGAQHQLGEMYAHGEGVPQDDQEAEHWRDRAAEQGVGAQDEEREEIDKDDDPPIRLGGSGHRWEDVGKDDSDELEEGKDEGE